VVFFLNTMFGKIVNLQFGLVILLFLSACSSSKHVQTDLQNPPEADQPVSAPTSSSVQAPDEALPGFDDVQDDGVADPVEPLNRAMFTFNDRLYFWVMKPAIKGYSWIMPEGARKSVRNFFFNIEMPVRFVSSLFQAQLKAMGVELARFTINSTIGVAGLFDVANSSFHLEPQEKDIGQTLGKYGIGEGLYFVWPFVGPSTARDTVGSIAELFLTPWRLVSPVGAAAAIGVYDYFNRASITSIEYEELVSASVEPYAALRNAYIQYRRNIVKNK
jgi:phospholipid-binding lipoprotein MlaA